MQNYVYRLMTDQIDGVVTWPAKILLKGVSFLYAWCVKGLAAIYERGILKRHELGRPVISVGNITWGGVGKTPLVLCIAEYLSKKNARPAILMRGYKSDSSGKNDEAAMLAVALPKVPIIIGKDRVKKAKQSLLNHTIDVFILDDGFQQWRINKDLEIVAIDATNPFGNGSVLPRGILRESLDSLGRADLLVITKSDLGKDNLVRIREHLSKINPKVPIVEAIHQPAALLHIHDQKNMDLTGIKGQDVCLLSSIGNPQSFEQTVDRLGANVRKRFIFPDHYYYTREDIQRIRDYCRQENIPFLLTTAKDESKLRDFPELWAQDQTRTLQVYILKINLTLVKGQDEFFRRIDRLLSR